MKLAWTLGIFAAVSLHAGVLLFGGLIFRPNGPEGQVVQEVELVSPEELEDKPKDKPEEQAATQKEELKTEQEEAPDANEILRNLETPAINNTPALEAASLSAIEQALNGGGGGGGDFADALTLAAGGSIGGSGRGGTLDESLESAFSMAEIDQKPRAVFQAAPLYPAEMRGKKVEAVVTVIFVVDASGKVVQPRVERSTLPAFEKPALDAVKQWKFEPAVRGGQRVNCKMRVPIRFQPS